MANKRIKKQNQYKNIKLYDAICINSPVPYSILAIWLAIITAGIVVFIINAEFCEKYTVNGFLNTTKAIAQIYPTRNGIISKNMVTQGSHIKKGEPMFAINTTYDTTKQRLTENELKQLQLRKQVIYKEIITKKHHLNDLAILLKKKYIPLTTYQMTQNEISVLNNNLHQVNMEILRLNNSRAYIIFAPISGTINNISYRTGQYVTSEKPILNILPDNTKLFAQLYVPVSKSGFINKNDKIILHYNAYPYQRFGAASAYINSISQTTLTDTDEIKPIKVGEPYYKINAKLNTQHISLYGKIRPLQQGMTCQAIIYGAKKKVWQWIFDPIYNFYGELLG